VNVPVSVFVSGTLEYFTTAVYGIESLAGVTEATPLYFLPAGAVKSNVAL